MAPARSGGWCLARATQNDKRLSIIVALVLASVSIVVAHWQRWRNLMESVNTGTIGSLLPIFNTACEVGYGNAIAPLPAFLVVRNAVLGVSDNLLVSEGVAVGALAGITGPASGGMNIALSMLGSHCLPGAGQRHRHQP